MTIRTFVAHVALALVFLSASARSQEIEQGQPPAKPPTTRPTTNPTDQRIAQLEAQVQALSKALEEMRKGPTTSKSPTTAPTAPPFVLDSKYQQSLTWRSIGPAGMGGRIVDFAVVESDPNTFFVATASGGLLKTVNNGYSFTHLFDRESTVSLGCVAVAPSDPNIVWAGTGENNPRNSVSWGDGVYKSTDGGKTWKNMGLKKSFQIGRIAIHRTNPNIVYVGALGRLYGPSEERGLYKTTDGGGSWQRVLFIDDKTGVIDVQMHPTDSETLLVATWERLRDGYDSHPGSPMQDGYDSYDPIQKWGKGSGLYKTTDGGQSFKKLTKGLPTNNLGRIGIEYYRKNPDTVYVIVDCEKIGMGTPPRSGASVYMDISAEDAEGGARVTGIRENGPSAKAGLLVDDLIQTVNDERITSKEKLDEVFREHKIGDKLRMKVLRGLNQLEIIVTLDRRPETSAGNVYMGLQGEDSEEGAKINSVIPEGPAEKAGLRADDIVQALNDKPITSYNQLLEEVRAKSAGDKVKIKILREGQSQEIEVTLAERPPGQGGFRRATPQPAGAYAGITGEEAQGGVRLTTIADNSPAAKAGLKVGDIVVGAEEKQIDKYEELVEMIRERKPGDKFDLKIKSGEGPREVALTLADRSGAAPATRPSGGNLGGQVENVQDEQGPNAHEYGGIYKSTDGGKTFRPDAGRNVHADQHALWIDPRDPRHMLVGCDGGFYATYDRTANWDHLNTVAIGQFYHVAICPQQPYHVAGGLQDNGSWCGPTVSLDGSGPINENWISVGGGDGFVCRVDWNDPDVIYSESQNGAIQRRNIRTGERASIRPPRADGAPAYRFNWNTPFILSNHNSRILYSAGNHVFRSLDRGNNMQVISPDITLTKWGSATALAESPKNPDLLYAGTDDGALWTTRDGGKSWTNIAKNVLPLPPGEGRGEGVQKNTVGAFRWVATIEPSHFVEGRAYVAFDAHRSDDDEPYIYLTEDFGKTWTSLRANLPTGSTRCLREDLINPNLLYLGTEFGAWCSLDRGKTWNKLGANLPTVAVHEFAIHPTAGEIVAATHGRSLWVLDVSALRQLKPDQLVSTPVLYQPNTTMRWRSVPAHARTNRRFNGQNPTLGAQIYYSLPKSAEKVSLKVLDIAGNTLRELPGSKNAGLNRITWDLRPLARSSPPTTQPNRMPTTRASRSTTRPASPQRATGESSGGAPQQRFGGLPPVPPGAYRLVLNVDGKEFSQTLRVDADPLVADSTMASNESELDENDEEEEEMEREQMREIRPIEID